MKEEILRGSTGDVTSEYPDQHLIDKMIYIAMTLETVKKMRHSSNVVPRQSGS